ncbi:MAG: DNA mismatch repair protein MutS [Desulfovibrionaceae bacterium]|nr:DNA mismatch repair protein MutS [Desulfovibrionaceae bacterium]
MSSVPKKLPPMFEQYRRIKEECGDALLFYRMGDFYELFFDDAVLAAKELQITLTSRNPDAEDPVPMCGVPWHAAAAYVAQLTNKGYSVAICEQMEDPRQSKGLVKRAVTRIVTPGTALEDIHLEPGSHFYLGAVYWNEETRRGGFAWLDASTGEWSGLFSRKQAEIWQWVQKMAPKELLLPDNQRLPPSLFLENAPLVRLPFQSHFALKRAGERLLEAQGVRELAALGLEGKTELVQVCGALVAYLVQTQKQELRHLRPFKALDLGRHLIIDEVTERNLEFFSTLDGRKGRGTLRCLLDVTVTPMGGRLLEERLRHPWRELETIEDTQNAVQHFVQADSAREQLRSRLETVYDLERLSTRICLNRAAPKDFVALRHSLAALPLVREILNIPNDPNVYVGRHEQDLGHLPRALYRLLSHWDDIKECRELLAHSLVDSPPPHITEGGLFRSGYNAELDELIELAEHGEERLQKLLEHEQGASGLPKLKLGFNRVFGYYFELSRAAGAGVTLPDHFIRRQSMANAERFTTPDLAELEKQIMSATEQRNALEFQLFQDLREQIAAVRPRLLFMAVLIAQLDYWQCLATLARRHAWTRPVLDESTELCIREGRHPVVEQAIGAANFVPNDIFLHQGRNLALITGPNMAGKSTVLRQTAIICIMAQMGSFVPATEAKLGLADRIFSRVGASDNLSRGQSTFMAEMMETARILRQATRRSLTILDEIGRGTSTYDGLALAWAVAEDMARRGSGCARTLFATHYHELTSLEGTVDGIFTMNIAIKEWGGELMFLHRLVPGPSDRSYGIEVARLAGVPQALVQRARQLLAALEKKRPKELIARADMLSLPGLEQPSAEKTSSAPADPVLSILRTLDPQHLTPLEALKILTEWKERWG